MISTIAFVHLATTSSFRSLFYVDSQIFQCSQWRSIISSLLVCLFSDSRPRNNTRRWKQLLFIESKFLFLLFKHLSVSPFAEEKALLFDDFRWPGFVREWKYLQAFRHWLTNTVRACIKIYYSFTTNPKWTWKKYVSLLSRKYPAEWKYLQAFHPWLTMFGKYGESMHTMFCNKQIHFLKNYSQADIISVTKMHL